MGRVFTVVLRAIGVGMVLAAAPGSSGSAEKAAPKDGVSLDAAGAPAALSAAEAGSSSAVTCAPAPPPVPEILAVGDAGKGTAPAQEALAPQLMPSVLLDDVSGGIFASPFWPESTKVPGSGPYPNGAGQAPPTRRPPGSIPAATTTSSLTITGTFP